MSENSIFRFAVIGAADIANKFCNAASYIEDCEVAAVASRSMERAQKFAEKNGIPKAYDDYEKMLVEVKPDAVYIAVTTNAHYEMCMLCLKHNIPFLCEKTMCIGSEQTKAVFDLAEEKGVFCMEAMWSRFLPAIKKVKEWLDNGRIGDFVFGDINVGFQPEADYNNRFYNKALGGGSALDLTVYCYEIMRYLIEKPVLEMQTMSNFCETGVDLSNVIMLKYADSMACLKGSIAAHYEEKMLLFGKEGSISVPSPHFASRASLIGKDGKVIEYYEDTETPGGNGFVHEIREVISCVRAGKTESDTVPHSLTLDYAGICDILMTPSEFDFPEVF